MAERRSYSEGFGFAMLSVGVLALLGIATSVLLARIYGIEVIGEFALVFAPTGAVWFLSTVREQPAMIRVLASAEPRSAAVSGVFFVVLAFSFVLTSVVVALVLVVSWFAFHGPLDRPELFWPAAAQLGGYLLFGNTATNLDSVFAAFRAGRQLFWIRVHETALGLALAAAAGLIWGTVWGITLSLVAATFSALIHRAVVVRHWMRFRGAVAAGRERVDTLWEIVRFGLKITPGDMADGVSSEAAVWILGALGSTAAVGAYSRAYSLGSRLAALNNRVTEIVLPTLVARHEARENARFDWALVESIRYVGITMLLPAAAFGGAATAMMELFGPGFSAGAGALALLMLLPALRTASSIQTMALLAVNRPWIATGIALVRMVVTLAACVLLIHAIGITGAALGIIAGVVVDATAKLFVMRIYMSAPLLTYWPLRQIGAVCLAYAGGFVSAHAVDSAIAGPSALLLAIPVGTLVYGVVFILLGGLQPRDRDRIARIWARFRGGLSRRLSVANN